MADNGPSDEILSFLKANMKEMADGVARGKLHGKGVSIPAPQFQPTKICVVCLGLFAPRRTSQDQPAKGVCGECRAKLTEGYTACIWDHKRGHAYAFVHFKANPEVMGKIVNVSAQQMERLQKKFAEEKEPNGQTLPGANPPQPA